MLLLVLLPLLLLVANTCTTTAVTAIVITTAIAIITSATILFIFIGSLYSPSHSVFFWRLSSLCLSCVSLSPQAARTDRRASYPLNVELPRQAPVSEGNGDFRSVSKVGE
jgi:hypothetical protein